MQLYQGLGSTEKTLCCLNICFLSLNVYQHMNLTLEAVEALFAQEAKIKMLYGSSRKSLEGTLFFPRFLS